MDTITKEYTILKVEGRPRRNDLKTQVETTIELWRADRPHADMLGYEHQADTVVQNILLTDIEYAALVVKWRANRRLKLTLDIH